MIEMSLDALGDVAMAVIRKLGGSIRAVGCTSASSGATARRFLEVTLPEGWRMDASAPTAELLLDEQGRVRAVRHPGDELRFVCRFAPTSSGIVTVLAGGHKVVSPALSFEAARDELYLICPKYKAIITERMKRERALTDRATPVQDFEQIGLELLDLDVEMVMAYWDEEVVLQERPHE